MRPAPLLIGAVAVAGLGLLARPGGPEAPREGLVVVPAPARAPSPRPAVEAVPRPRFAMTSLPPPRPEVAVTGHLDDAAVRDLHARIGWDGAAAPGIWATPATFSAGD